MTEPPIKVKHHYVPICYLRMFTASQMKDELLNVNDLTTNKEWKSSPEKIACENHYNTAEGDLRPDAFEDIFEKVESGAAPIWQRMIQEKRIPDDPDELNWILNFLALLKTRTKPTRKWIDDFYVQIYELISDFITATPERFANLIAEAKKAGVDIPELTPDVTLEDIRARIRDGSIKISADIHNNYYLEQTFEHANIVLRLFHDREWAVCDLSRSSVDLVTSDNPISIVWTKQMPALYPPGLGLKNTLVFVPLAPKLVMLGAFETEVLKPIGNSKLADELFVRYLNCITISQAYRFVFSQKRSDLFSNSHQAKKR